MKHITRLRKLREKEIKQITKVASTYIPLDHIVLNSGDYIDFNARTVNNKPWYQIKQEFNWDTSSYYDGPDFQRACEVYKELLMSFKSISAAESFVKSIPHLSSKIEKYYEVSNLSKFQEYHNLIQKSPKFLGFNDF